MSVALHEVAVTRATLRHPRRHREKERECEPARFGRPGTSRARRTTVAAAVAVEQEVVQPRSVQLALRIAMPVFGISCWRCGAAHRLECGAPRLYLETARLANDDTAARVHDMREQAKGRAVSREREMVASSGGSVELSAHGPPRKGFGARGRSMRGEWIERVFDAAVGKRVAWDSRSDGNQ